MGYIYERTYTERFEVTQVKLNFMDYKAFSKVRKDKPNCGMCGSKFQQEDKTNLAFVEGRVNQLICDTCAKEAVAGGAKGV